MKRGCDTYKLIISIVSIIIFISNSYAQDIDLKGRVLDSYDSTAVTQVNISILGTNKGSSTDGEGYFVIDVSVGDTLVFSAVQYKSQMYVVDATNETTLYLEPELYELNEVTIKSFSKEKFRQEFIQLEVPPNSHPISLNIPIDISYMPLEEKILAPPSPGEIPSGFGITLYPNWNFRANQLKWQRKQVDLWKEKEAFQQVVAGKYNRDVVRQYTDLSDEQLEAFMKYCDLQPGFIYHATEYEIAEAIKTCYLAYVE